MILEYIVRVTPLPTMKTTLSRRKPTIKRAGSSCLRTKSMIMKYATKPVN